MSVSRNTIELIVLGRNQADSALNAAGRGLSSFGGNVQRAGRTALLGAGLAGAGIAAVGVAAFNAAMTLDEAFNTIRIGTGATGAAFEGLKDDFRAVFADVPATAAETSAVIADLNTRLGLTGEALQTTATQMLNLSRITGTDAANNVRLATRVFGDWAVETEDQARALDQLFLSSQSTGIGVDQLMNKVVQFGAPLRQMGFSFEESITLLGKWEKEGVNTELVLGSLRIAANNFAEANIDLSTGLEQTIQRIQGATSEAEALSIAAEVFGARSGPDMAAAIREGRFELGDLIEQLNGASGAINQTAKDTETIGQKFQRLKNRLTLALEPIGKVILQIAEQLMDFAAVILPQVVTLISPFINRITGLFDGLFGVFQLLFRRDITGGFLRMFGLAEDDPIVQTILQVRDAFVSLLGLASLAEGAFGAGVFFEDGARAMEVFRNGLGVLAEHFGFSATAVLGFVDTVIGLIETIAGVVGPVINWIKENISLKDVLIALGIAVASVVIPVVLGLVVAIGSAVAPILLVIATVALLREAWVNDFMGMRTFIEGPFMDTVLDVANRISEGLPTAFAMIETAAESARRILETSMVFIGIAIDNAKPIIDSLVVLFEEFLTPAIEFVADVIETLFLANLQITRDFIESFLLPTFMNIVGFFLDDFIPAVTEAIGIIFGPGSLKEKLEALGGVFINLAEDAIQRVINQFGIFKGFIQDVIDTVVDLISNLNILDNIDITPNINLPSPGTIIDALIPGSPVPLAEGLREVGRAMDELSAREFSIAGPQIGAGSTSAGSQQIIHNTINFNGSLDSRGNAQEAAFALVDDLNRRGERV